MAIWWVCAVYQSAPCSLLSVPCSGHPFPNSLLPANCSQLLAAAPSPQAQLPPPAPTSSSYLQLPPPAPTSSSHLQLPPPAPSCSSQLRLPASAPSSSSQPQIQAQGTCPSFQTELTAPAPNPSSLLLPTAFLCHLNIILERSRC
jgi:hypothetical protein